jgi:hypothetical protein
MSILLEKYVDLGSLIVLKELIQIYKIFLSNDIESNDILFLNSAISTFYFLYIKCPVVIWMNFLEAKNTLESI